jgi:hypothetical protein
MRLSTACLARLLLVLALMFGPVWHASAFCDMSAPEHQVGAHMDAHDHAGHDHQHGPDTSHHSEHSSAPHHHANGCCDAACAMACAAMLTTVAAPYEPLLIADNLFAEPTALPVGSSPNPDPHPPKSASQPNAAI